MTQAMDRLAADDLDVEVPGRDRRDEIADMAKAVFAAAGKAPDIDYIPMPPEIRDRYQYFTQAEMARLRQAGYEAPFTSLEAGIEDYVRNYLSQPDPYL